MAVGRSRRPTMYSSTVVVYTYHTNVNENLTMPFAHIYAALDLLPRVMTFARTFSLPLVMFKVVTQICVHI